MNRFPQQPATGRRRSIGRALLLCLVAACAPSAEPDPAVVTHHAPAAYATLAAAAPETTAVEAERAPRAAAPRAKLRLAHPSASAAPVVAARADTARPAPRKAPRAGGAALASEPRPSFYWDDCVMAGLAVNPHCGV